MQNLEAGVANPVAEISCIGRFMKVRMYSSEVI